MKSSKQKRKIIPPPPPPVKYRPEMCQSLIDHMAKGFSYSTWGAIQKDTISISTMYEWEKNYTEWKEAKEIGYHLGLYFYENLNISKATGKVKKVDGYSVQFTLRTRFHKEYGEQQKLEHNLSNNAISVSFVSNDDD